MNTKEAFKILLASPEKLKKLKAKDATIRKHRQRFNQGILPLEKQIELLKKVAKKVKEEEWEFKIK